ncbi:MAG: hypothetical protein Q7R93_02720 [bacterium]|nr:hypothetical protein [bacterium]
MKFLRLFRFLSPLYWRNVREFGKPSADAGCSVLKDGVENSAIQMHSIMTAMGDTKKSQAEIIQEARRCVAVGGDFVRK